MLESIIKSTQARVASLKSKYNSGFFEDSELFSVPVVSLKEYLTRNDKNGIIAEFKRCSPSKGMLNAFARVDETTIGYMRAGCSALSIITEPDFFMGHTKDLTLARKFNYCPILRKDFIIDPIQLYETRSIGADAVLLISKILSNNQLNELTMCAKELGLEILFEIDVLSGFDRISSKHDLVGVNSRELNTMNVDFNALVSFMNDHKSEKMFIAESGIKSAADYVKLKSAGYKGFLIGTQFMSSGDPANACQNFCNEIDFLYQKELTFSI